MGPRNHTRYQTFLFFSDSILSFFFPAVCFGVGWKTLPEKSTLSYIPISEIYVLSYT